MLKWAAVPRQSQCRRLASNCAQSNTPRSATPRAKGAKRRRRSSGTRKSAQDKENQFTSTPIKSDDNRPPPPLRDVSNLTPNEGRRPKPIPKSGTPRATVKKKKECLDNHTQYFKPFEAVDSHIESVLAEQCRSCKKNLFCGGPGDRPPTNKVESIEDLLPDGDELALPGLILNPDTERLFDGGAGVRITPLVRKFWDLQFSKCAADDPDDSSYINDMSLDKIVDAILDKSADADPPDLIANASLVVNVEAGGHGDGISHHLRGNCFCKCNNNFPLEKTVIQIDETYNERCVDARKRPSTSDADAVDGAGKRPKLDENCTLKRQKCVRRRRKVAHFRKKLMSELDSSIESKTIAPFWSARKQLAAGSDEDSPLTGNTPTRGCYLESKAISGSRSGTVDGVRRCLGFASPKTTNDSGSFCESTARGADRDVGGSLDLALRSEGDSLLLTVIRCRDLCRPNGGDKINAYVKVTSGDVVLQRTPVQGESSRPVFNHTFRLSADRPLVRIEIWHRDRATKTSEFLGCMSFDVGDACDKKICGSYRLLPEAVGRAARVPIAALDPSPSGPRRSDDMGEHNRDADDVASLDGGVDHELRRSTNKAALSEQQKYADENLFLRYLELDPTEGPEAIPAATQRRATGNKSGRTPFTQTKRLTRPAKSGFGFSVVWTHPPRIERVERGLPADRAGILPGDYIIFVDKHNVVTMPEIEILNLIRSYGSQLTLEIFRRNPSRNGSLPASSAGPTTCGSAMTDSDVTLAPPPPHRRPSTICSTNTASVQDLGRRKLHLPQVTFSTETASNDPEDGRKRTMYQLIGKEQHYCTDMQFGVGRFVSPLAERRDLISPSEHRVLFQNCDELLRITEDILDHLVHDDGEVEAGLLVRVYSAKLRDLTCAYRRYCAGLKKADCVLANKLKNSGAEFFRFVQSPAIPRRRPDLTAFIHKPLEHYREVLKALMAVQSATKSKHPDYVVINRVVHEMQVSYREMTAEAGLMEPTGEGRPLLSVQDLENRLVFTKCRPFVLNKPGRQWIFGGALSRVEGRDLAQYWALLFSDILLLAKVSRDRVLFVADDPIQLAYVTDMFFNVRKKDTEFRICVDAGAKNEASSPTVHCGPDLSRTPRKNVAKKCTVALRAPTLEMKAVWQNLLQRQILQLNSGLDGSSLSSPPESPDEPITSSVVTLQSAETCSLRRQPAAAPNLTAQNRRNDDAAKRQIETLIEHKCKQMGKGSADGKCNAIHLERWMKGQLRDGGEPPADSPDEQVEVEWTAEMLRQRSEELQLIDRQGRVTNSLDCRMGAARPDELSDHEQSPSKSTTTESQVTVRSSPVVPESVAVCKQCHKNCLSNVVAATTRPCPTDRREAAEDWQSLVLLGLRADPVAGFLNYDPFRSAPAAAPTPDGFLVNGDGGGDVSADDSPQTEEHPYRSLSSSALTLRRFGTVSSLERVGSEERVEENRASSGESGDDDEEDEEEELGVDNEAFNNRSSLTSWTAKAGSFVAQKMAFFERLGEECGGAFFERYLKSNVNGDDVQEEETSGGTSGEEIWGTPTSGGDLDEPPISPDREADDGSPADVDDTEIMMDELLMAPPVTGAAIRGLLPRRTLEPLIEEDFSETSSSAEYSDEDDASARSGSSEQGNPTESAADARSPDAVALGGSADAAAAAASSPDRPVSPADDYETGGDGPKTSNCSGESRIPRSASYRRIVDAAEDATTVVPGDAMFFQQFRPAASFVNIARVSRSKSVRIFEFFNVRRTERRIYEKFPVDGRLAKMFSKENVVADSVPTCYDTKTVPVNKLKDKQVDRRFWKQLSRRRTSLKVNPPA